MSAAVAVDASGACYELPERFGTIAALLRVSRVDLERAVDSARPTAVHCDRRSAPIDGATEVWAAGVTFKRSEEARVQESQTPDIYTRVYGAIRPELFFKATARRVRGQGEPVVIRADSEWDVPEPELALVLNAAGEVIGYTIANDVSSRSIEGENPLYLPQAKVYDGSCGLGPEIVLAREISDPYALRIDMRIERDGGVVWSGDTSMAQFNRRLADLVEHLFREDRFPDGVVLCTGASIVPPDTFTLRDGDTVRIAIERLGVLVNPVVRSAHRNSASLGREIP